MATEKKKRKKAKEGHEGRPRQRLAARSRCLSVRRGSEAEVGRWKEDGRASGQRMKGKEGRKEASRAKSWETKAKRLSARPLSGYTASQKKFVGQPILRERKE